MKRRLVFPQLAWLLTAAAASLSCSVFVDAGRPQCKSDADCVGRGEGWEKAVCVDALCVANPMWSCLDQPRTAPPDDGVFDVDLRLIDLLTQSPLSGVTAQLCYRADAECSTPASDEVVSNNKGIASFRVPAGFDGYALLNGENIAPALYFLNPPIASDTETPSIPLASREVVDVLLQREGGMLGADRGIVVVTSQDCQGAPAAGVSYSASNADKDTRTFYAVNNLPSTSLTSTDMSGYGGLINVPAGIVAIEGTLLETGESLGKVGVLVRSDALTYTRMVPLGK